MKSLILTGTTLDEHQLMEAIARGVSGYLLKVAPMTEVLDGIREVARGRTVLAGVAAQASEPISDASPAAPELSEREKGILELVAAEMTNRQIARRLNTAEQTVKNHISKLLQKLGLESRTQAAVYATQRRARDSS